MRPIESSALNEAAPPLASDEVLVAITPENLADIAAGLRALRLIAIRDEDHATATRKPLCAVPGFRAVQDRAQQLEADFRSIGS